MTLLGTTTLVTSASDGGVAYPRTFDDVTKRGGGQKGKASTAASERAGKRPTMCYVVFMGSEAKQLLDRAMHLSERDRAELAARLIDSLDAKAAADVDAAWATEIARRAGELDSGAAKGVPWSEARRLILSDD